MREIKPGNTSSRPPFHMVFHSSSQPGRYRFSKPVLLLGAALLLVVVWQLAYPRDRALPLARLDGSMVGGKRVHDIEKLITDEYTTASVTVRVDDDTYKTTADAVGLVPSAQVTTKNLSSYSTWQRFVPFTMLVVGLTRNQPVATTLDEATFANYVPTLQHSCAIAVTPARLSYKGSIISVEEAQDGRACSEEAIRAALQDVGLRKDGVEAPVRSEVVVAPGKDIDTADIARRAEKIADHTIVLSIDGVRKTIAKKDIVQWLTLPYDEEAKQYNVAVDDAAVRAYVTEAQSSVYVEPGVTHIHNDTNGIERGRESGTAGRGLDVVTVANELATTVMSGDGTVEASVITLMPTIKYDNAYSPDRAGLQKLLDDIVKNKGDYGIAFASADGSLAVQSNGDAHYRPASTYKMIVAWAILKRIDAGQMKWSDGAVLGMTVSECFDTMIIDSNNECGEYFGGTVIGWASLNKMALGLGMTCSDWNSQWYSCAKDEVLFLHKLSTGQLLDTTQTERLLSVMRRQVYRAGIPSGVNWAVADKVGFLNGLLHDASIVNSPHGTYSLVIMTDASSWSQIADAAWQIDAHITRMNQ